MVIEMVNLFAPRTQTICISEAETTVHGVRDTSTRTADTLVLRPIENIVRKPGITAN